MQGMLRDKTGTRWAMTIACGLASIGALRWQWTYVIFGIIGVTMLVAAVIAFTFPRLRKKEA